MSVHGDCPKCGGHKKLTKHHVLPRCHYKQGSGKIEYVCRECHDELEIFIMAIEGKNNKGKRNKLTPWEYEVIYFQFIH